MRSSHFWRRSSSDSASSGRAFSSPKSAPRWARARRRRRRIWAPRGLVAWPARWDRDARAIPSARALGTRARLSRLRFRRRPPRAAVAARPARPPAPRAVLREEQRRPGLLAAHVALFDRVKEAPEGPRIALGESLIGLVKQKRGGERREARHDGGEARYATTRGPRDA